MNERDKQWNETLNSEESAAFNAQAQEQAMQDIAQGKAKIFNAQELLLKLTKPMSHAQECHGHDNQNEQKTEK